MCSGLGKEAPTGDLWIVVSRGLTGVRGLGGGKTTGASWPSPAAVRSREQDSGGAIDLREIFSYG